MPATPDESQFLNRFELLLAEGRAADASEYLGDLLPQLNGAARQRAEASILVARACAAKWRNDPRYVQRLREFFTALSAARWTTVLANRPELLAELCADALSNDIAADFCRALVAERALVLPVARVARGTWPLTVRVLGEFGVTRDGVPIHWRAGGSTRAFDVLRVLATAKGHVCTMQHLQDSLWPDAGARANAACDEALDHLSRLLGRSDLIEQRDGKVRFATDKVWVDLDQWEVKLAGALWSNPDGLTTDDEMQRAIDEFPGALLSTEPLTSWSAPAAERIRSAFVEVVLRLGHRREERGDIQKACDAYVRALEVYPNCDRCLDALRAARALGESRRQVYSAADVLRRRSEAADT